MGKEVTTIVAGTGAAIEIDLGFPPESIEVLNVITRTKLVFNRFDTENLLGVAYAAAGTATKATAGIVLGDILADDKAFTLAAAATVNANGNDLQITAKQQDYVLPIDHTPRFQDAAESTGGIFDVPA